MRQTITASRPFLNRGPTSLLRLLSLAIGLIFLWPTAASAQQGLEPALTQMANKSRTQVKAGINALGLSALPRALIILEALEEKTLYFDESSHVLIRQGETYVSALSGNAEVPTGELRKLMLNNLLRRSLRPALAQQRLRSTDRATRFKAATELSRRPAEEMVETMRSAASSESDSDIATLLRLAVAQIDVESGDSARILSALRIMEADGDLSHKPAIQRVLESQLEDAPSSERIRSGGTKAIAGIMRRSFYYSSLANLFYGLSLGSVLLLAALGLAITFGLMKVINMAHGELLMIGAYSTFVMQNIFASSFPAALDFYLVAAVPFAFCVAAAVGLLMERTVIRFLYGRPLETLLATWGLSLFLIQTVRLTFGAQNVTVRNPSWLSGGIQLMPTLVLPYSRIATIGFAIVVVAFVWYLLRRTRLGLYVRAVTQNREMAGNLGLPTAQIDMWTFALGSGIAGLGGVALSQLSNVGPELGQGYIVDSFMVVVLGGVGNIAGTVAGAMGLGLANKFLEPVMGAVLGKIAILVLVIIFIQKRPQGMFAPKGRNTEL